MLSMARLTQITTFSQYKRLSTNNSLNYEQISRKSLNLPNLLSVESITIAYDSTLLIYIIMKNVDNDVLSVVLCLVMLFCNVILLCGTILCCV